MSTSDSDPEVLQNLDDERTARIRELNDAFRTSLGGFSLGIAFGTVAVTAGVRARGDGFVDRAYAAVRAFDAFTEANDPWGEHAFGAFDLDGVRLNWKIDYYDNHRDHGSPDPADPAVTHRVLTLLLAEEY